MSSASQSSEGVRCESCHRSFDTEHGLRVHLAMVHDETLIESQICPTCEEEFDPERERQVYCTTDCVNKANRNREWIECVECSSEFEVLASHADRYSRCEPCRNESKKVELICECCYGEFSVDPSVEHRRRHCNKHCLSRSLQKWFGYNNTTYQPNRPNTFDGLVRRAYIYEAHSFAATCRIVNRELDEECSEQEIREQVDELMTHERNVRNRVWALRPEDLGLAPIGEVP